MIFVTGDTHGDKKRFALAKKHRIKKNDTLIICGDFGFIWSQNKEEQKILKWIGNRKYKVFFVDGFNDSHELIDNYELEEFDFGKARRIYKNLYCLKRGEVYDIEDKKIFAFGGGDNIEHTNKTGSMPNEQDFQNGLDNLKKQKNEIDIIITHEAPTRILKCINMDKKGINQLNTYLESISDNITFKQWYIGKYHINKKIPPCYNIVFSDIIKYEE